MAEDVGRGAREDVALEFFSGIGGFHYALRAARPRARVARAFDVDDVATRVYAANFGAAAAVSALDVCHLDAGALNRLGAGLWMLSPPCQPYTRQGNGLGADDARAGGLAHLTRLLAADELEPPDRLLMENVVGFESSQSRDALVGALRARGFAIRELWLSPVHVGVPNQRTRYFLLARRARVAPCRAPSAGIDEAGGASAPVEAEARAPPAWPSHPLLDAHELAPWDAGAGRPLPDLPRGCVCVVRQLREFLEPAGGDADAGTGADAPSVTLPVHAALPAAAPRAAAAALDASRAGAVPVPVALTARYGRMLDVVCATSAHSGCFTKNYARYVKGTGSVLAAHVEREEVLADADNAARAGWGLRYFTPREIANLHGFPRGDAFAFPADVPLRKRYNLLGNSLSVDVVAELLRHLYETP